MRLVILGSGTSGSQMPGIPNRYPPAFLVEWDNEKILFDCSEGVRFRIEQAGYFYPEIHHIALSHAHPDHNALVNYVHSNAYRNCFVEPQNTHINIYAPQQIVDDFPSVWKGYVPDAPEREAAIWPKLTFHAVSENVLSSYKIASGTLKGFNVFHGHGKIEAVSFRLETPSGIFAYSGDTGDCAGVRAACKDADLFVCEASAKIGAFEDALAYGHLTPKQAGEIAKNGGVKKLILFHFSGMESEEQILNDCLSSGFKGELVCGNDFDVFDLLRTKSSTLC